MKEEIIVVGERLLWSTSSILDVPTLDDEYPWGITMEKAEDNLLRNIHPWHSNNFCNYGIGATKDKEHKILFCGCFNLTGAKIHKVAIDGRWFELRGSGPARYDEGIGHFTHPTIYADAVGNGIVYTIARTYHYPERKWIWRIQNQDGSIILNVELNARGQAFWFGKPSGPYIMHGLASPLRRRTFDVWGGFLDFCDFVAELKAPTIGVLSFRGFAGVDREWHKRIGENPDATPPYHAVLCYNAFALINEEIDMIIYESFDPWTGEEWARTGRIRLIEEDAIYPFDNFKFTDNGGLTPTEYKIEGKFKGGSLDVSGRIINRWWERRVVERIPVSFNQPFIEWKGKIVVDGRAINISALGVAEFTRMKRP